MANISTAKRYFDGITEQDISRLNQIKSTYNREIGRVSSKLNEINFGVWNDPVSRALAKYQKKVSTKISDISTDVDNGGNLDNLIGSIKTLRAKSKEYIEWYNYNPHAEYGRTDKENYEELQREIENRKNNLDRLGREIDQYASQIKGFTFRGVTPELKDVQIERPTEPKPKPVIDNNSFALGKEYTFGGPAGYKCLYCGYIVHNNEKIPIFQRRDREVEADPMAQEVYYYFDSNNFLRPAYMDFREEFKLNTGSCQFSDKLKELMTN